MATIGRGFARTPAVQEEVRTQPALAPGMVMHGNQPGVAQANGGTMQVQTDFSKTGDGRYSITNQAPGTPAAQSALRGMAAPASAPPPDQWGNTDSSYLRSQVDRIFGQHGRKAREDEYLQWEKYMQTPDVDGTGRALLGWDPYWESRLGMHATGDYYGNGTTPDDVGQAQMAQQAKLRNRLSSLQAPSYVSMADASAPTESSQNSASNNMQFSWQGINPDLSILRDLLEQAQRGQ